MHISYKGDYALKTVLDLAMQYNQKLVTIPELATRLDIPRKFLEQILLDLKRGGFVESKRGKEGGYFLAKPPVEITMGDIIRFIEGPLEPIACVDDCYKGCADVPTCVFRPIFQKTAQAISTVLDQVTFETLLNDVKKRQEALHFFI
jgi:Rrf2 family protein